MSSKRRIGPDTPRLRAFPGRLSWGKSHPADELIHRYYGVESLPLIAGRINRAYGANLSGDAVFCRAKALGLRADTAQGMWTVAALAGDLGISAARLSLALRRRRLDFVRGRRHTLIPDETVAVLREVYQRPTVPTLSLVEAAARVCYSENTVRKWIAQGRLSAVKQGACWRIPVVEVEKKRAEILGVPFWGLKC